MNLKLSAVVYALCSAVIGWIAGRRLPPTASA
jgi:hypothetical protein